MKRTDADGNLSGLYTDGDPVGGVPATVVNASALNNIQEELVSIVLAAGLGLNGAVYTQVLTAIKQLIQDGALWSNLSIGNNQVVAASLSGLLFDKTKEYGARVLYHLHRHTDTGGSEVVSMGQLSVRYLPAADAWDITDNIMAGDDHGVTFSVTSSGQVQYVSSNIAGANYVGELRVSDLKKIRKS
jgi:hypothetical protein